MNVVARGVQFSLGVSSVVFGSVLGCFASFCRYNHGHCNSGNEATLFSKSMISVDPTLENSYIIWASIGPTPMYAPFSSFSFHTSFSQTSSSSSSSSAF